MKIAIPHALAVIVITLAAARPAVAAEAETAVIEAFLGFVDALEAGDAAGLQKYIFADTPFQERIRRMFIELATAQKSLEKSALARFGEEGKRFRCGFELIVNGADRKTIAGARVTMDDLSRVAHIEKPGELAPMTLRRYQNQWQVVLEHIDDEETEHAYSQPPYAQPQAQARREAQAAIKLARHNAIIEAFRQTQSRIEAGQITSAAAAQAELTAKFVAASAEAAKARAAIPSNRTFKDR